jgi:hypothetical protein
MFPEATDVKYFQSSSLQSWVSLKALFPMRRAPNLWRQSDFMKWARKAVSVVRDLRTNFIEPGDLVWQAQAAEGLEKNGLSAVTLIASLKKTPVIGQLKIVG